MCAKYLPRVYSKFICPRSTFSFRGIINVAALSPARQQLFVEFKSKRDFRLLPSRSEKSASGLSRKLKSFSFLYSWKRGRERGNALIIEPASYSPKKLSWFVKCSLRNGDGLRAAAAVWKTRGRKFFASQRRRSIFISDFPLWCSSAYTHTHLTRNRAPSIIGTMEVYPFALRRNKKPRGTRDIV